MCKPEKQTNAMYKTPQSGGVVDPGLRTGGVLSPKSSTDGGT